MTFDPQFLPAGSLRHSITIQEPSSSRDAAGQPIDGWTDVLTTRASIESISLKEQLVSGSLALSSQVTHVVTIRYPGSAYRIVSGQRVVFNDRRFRIQAVNNVSERNRILKLTCIEVDAAR